METLRNFARTMGPVRLAVLAITALLLAGFFAWIVSQASTAPQALLFGDLDAADAARVVAQLDASGVPYTLGNGGTTIFVASDQVARTRLALAEQGLPAGGSIGYEIFDTSDMLGASSFQQNINLVRALEGELARTIRSIATVKAARVHLVLPRREVFSRDKAEASASVLLQMRGRARLTPAQVAAVQQLVATAVPGLTPARISIIDGQGTLLSEGQDSGDPVAALGAKADHRRRELESRLSRTIEELVERTVGPGNVRAEVSAEMDFDRVNTSEEIFDPDGQVVRSTQTVEQNTSSHDGSSAPPVSVATNLPDAVTESTAENTSASTDTRNEETVNYEISKKVINHVRESGVVKRLSVAVLVDGTSVIAEDGTRTYQPRSAEELQQLTTLVQTAVGFDAQRGDTVEVVSMRFAAPDLPPEIDTSVLLGLEKSELIRIGSYIGIFVLAVLVLLLVIRPIVARAVQAIPVAPAGAAAARSALPGTAGQPALLPGQAPSAQLTAPDGGDASGAAQIAGETEPEDMIDIQRVDGRVRASSLKRVSEIVDKHPDETLAIVRNWLHDQD